MNHIIETAVTRALRFHGSNVEPEPLYVAAHVALARAESQFRGSRGSWGRFARSAVRRAVSRAAWEAMRTNYSCPRCRDSGCFPGTSPGAWAFCLCGAGEMRCEDEALDVGPRRSVTPPGFRLAPEVAAIVRGMACA